MSTGRRCWRWIIVASVVCSQACRHSDFDPKKFDAVQVAAQSVRADPNADRLRLFGSEISLAQGRVTGGDLLRFRDIDPDAPGGMVLLRGANRPIAMRYGIPIEERGGGRWVSKKAR